MAVTYTESSSLPAAAPSGTDTYAQADLRTEIKESLCNCNSSVLSAGARPSLATP